MPSAKPILCHSHPVRAVHGKRLLPMLAEQFTPGQGIYASGLRCKRLRRQAFPKRDALRHELRSTHHRLRTRPDPPRTIENPGQIGLKPLQVKRS